MLPSPSEGFVFPGVPPSPSPEHESIKKVKKADNNWIKDLIIKLFYFNKIFMHFYNLRGVKIQINFKKLYFADNSNKKL